MDQDDEESYDATVEGDIPYNVLAQEADMVHTKNNFVLITVCDYFFRDSHNTASKVFEAVQRGPPDLDVEHEGVDAEAYVEEVLI